jgi:hypothetical protein
MIYLKNKLLILIIEVTLRMHNYVVPTKFGYKTRIGNWSE